MSYLPEEAGGHVSEARHGERWLYEIPDEVAPPMVRIRQKDFYLFEPVVLWNHPLAEYCIPIRWFTRKQEIFARCYKLYPCNNGWEVAANELIEVHQSQLLLNFVDFCVGHHRYEVPDLQVIHGP